MRFVAHMAVLALVSLHPQPLAAEDLFDAGSGLRIAAYRAPVPGSVPGGRVIGADDLARIAAGGALLLDVLPAPGHMIQPDGSWIMPERHQTIAGAVWLPETGRGDIEPDIADYLDHSLALCTGGERAHPIAVFCRSDCWMSWNAVQRIAGLGYDNLYWFPGGIEEWQDLDRPMQTAIPLPVGAASCR